MHCKAQKYPLATVCSAAFYFDLTWPWSLTHDLDLPTGVIRSQWSITPPSMKTCWTVGLVLHMYEFQYLLWPWPLTFQHTSTLDYCLLPCQEWTYVGWVGCCCVAMDFGISAFLTFTFDPRPWPWPSIGVIHRPLSTTLPRMKKICALLLCSHGFWNLSFCNLDLWPMTLTFNMRHSQTIVYYHANCEDDPLGFGIW